MRKILFVMAAFALILGSCDEKVSGPDEQFAEVSFSVNEADFVTLKSSPGTPGNVPECSDLSMDFAVITIDGMDYTTEIFYANGKYVTQPLKILIGANVPEGANDSKIIKITRFLVYNGDKEDVVNATLIKAAPEDNSDYWDLVDPARRLDLEVTVEKFKKVEAAIDVLCFDPLYYQNFGFTWFKLELMTVKSLCFFGDICTGKLEQYMREASPYLPQTGNYDLAAVMRVSVYKMIIGEDEDYVFVADYNNWDNWIIPGVGDCMTVYWGDYDEKDEDYKIVLEVLLPVGNTLDYVEQYTWSFNDDAIGTADPSYPQTNMWGDDLDDGVVDFVVGECAYDKPDYTFAPHQNLPAGVLDMKVRLGTMGHYVDIQLTGDGTGYDIPVDGTWIGGWCGDKYANIGTYTWYDVKAYSSLKDLDFLTTNTNLEVNEIQKLNYLFNHIDDVIANFQYSPMGIDNGNAIQDAIWAITDGLSVSGTAADLAANANSYGAGYIPQPGEWAAVFFYDGNADKRIQIMFTVVDP
jgi:hypothetical protein